MQLREFPTLFLTCRNPDGVVEPSHTARDGVAVDMASSISLPHPSFPGLQALRGVAAQPLIAIVACASFVTPSAAHAVFSAHSLTVSALSNIAAQRTLRSRPQLRREFVRPASRGCERISSASSLLKCHGKAGHDRAARNRPLRLSHAAFVGFEEDSYGRDCIVIPSTRAIASCTEVASVTGSPSPARLREGLGVLEGRWKKYQLQRKTSWENLPP